MLHRFAASLFALACSLSLAAGPAMAQDGPGPQDQLFAALKLPEIIQVMRAEGIAYGAGIGADLFAGGIDPDWTAEVAQIYDAGRMTEQAITAFRAELAGADIAPMLAFFTTEPGLSFATLEVSARTALLDPSVDAASKEIAAIASLENDTRHQLLMRFAEANDLIENNVVGAMNSNYAFYLGLMDGGAAQPGVSEAEVLASVWDQEARIRDTTTLWVTSFLLMAYQPLSDADIEAYIAFSESPAGQDLNRAVFTAFDGVFVDISRALGTASARYMVGDTL